MSNNDQTELGGYILDAEYPKVETVTSGPLKIFTGMRIYPLRYGVYKKDCSEEELYSTNCTPLPLSGREGYPKLDEHGYDYHTMPLRKGWLYVSCKDSKGVYIYSCYEQSYRLTRFISKIEGLEPLYPKGTTTDFIPATSTTKVYLFFTEVLLTKEDVLERFFDGDMPKLTNGLDCAKWSSSDGVSLSDITKRILDPTHANPVIGKSYDIYSEQSIKRHDIVYKNILQRNSTEVTENRDLFFVINDILGIAEQIRVDLTALHIEHEAIIRSIRIGVDPKVILNRMYKHSRSSEEPITDKELAKDPLKPQLHEDLKQLEQIALIHTVAVHIYQMVYNRDNPGYITKAKRSIDHHLIPNMLAVEERAEIRSLIDEKRKALMTVIDSSEFQYLALFYSNAFKDEASDITKHNYNHFLVESKKKILEVYQDLSILPHTKDTYLNLPQIAKNYTDPCLATLKRTVEKLNNVGKLLSVAIDIEEYAFQIDENPEKANRNINSVITLVDYALYTCQDAAFKTQSMRLIVDSFKKITSKGQMAFRVDKERIKKELKRKGKKNLSQVKNAGKTKWDITTTNKKDFSRGIIKIDVKKETPTKADRIFRSLCTNKLYIGVMSGLALQSIGDIIEEGDKNGFKSIVRSGELAMTITSMQRRYKEASIAAKFASGRKARNIKTLKLDAIGKQINILCGIGSYAGAGVDFINAFSIDDDHDAMACHIIAGVAGVASGSILLIYASATWAGPVGIALAVTISLARIAATYFTDTALENFLKNTIFNNKLKFSNTRTTTSTCSANYTFSHTYGEPFEVVKDISKEKWRKKGAEKKEILKDYNYILEELIYTQLMIPFFKLEIFYGFRDEYIGRSGYIGRTVNSFRATISSSFIQAKLDVTEVDIQPFYAIDRINWSGLNDGYLPLFATKEELSNLKAPNNYNKWLPPPNRIGDSDFTYNYKIYDEGRLNTVMGHKDAYIIALIRLKLADGTVIPRNRNNTPQYLIYRYKIEIPRKEGALCYANPTIYVDKVYIGEWTDLIFD